MRVVRVRFAVFAATLLLAGIAPVPAYAATPTTTVVTLQTADPQFQHEICIGVASTVTADGSSFTGGKVTIYDTTTGSDVFYFDQTYDSGSGVSWCKPDGYPIGPRSFRADYSGNVNYEASSGTLEFEVPKMTPHFALITVPASPDAGSPYQLTAGFTTDGGYAEQNTVEVHLEGVADPICSGTVAQWETHQLRTDRALDPWDVAHDGHHIRICLGQGNDERPVRRRCPGELGP